MKPIKVHDRLFEPMISKQALDIRVKELAVALSATYSGQKPLFLAVLNGAFIFAADLLRQLDFPHEISFVKISSYHGITSSGQVRQLIGLSENLEGRNVIILEDIVETGRTLKELIAEVSSHGPDSISVISLLLKPVQGFTPPPVDFVGFEIEDRFVLGYGLDYDGYGRNLAEIYGEVPA